MIRDRLHNVRMTVARAVGEDAKEIKKDLSVIVDDSKPAEPGEED